jgi:hypothetical protein
LTVTDDEGAEDALSLFVDHYEYGVRLRVETASGWVVLSLPHEEAEKLAAAILAHSPPDPRAH